MKLNLSAFTTGELIAMRDAINDELGSKPVEVMPLNECEKYLIRGGYAIQAIKLMRDRHTYNGGQDPGLKRLKDAVDAYRNTF